MLNSNLHYTQIYNFSFLFFPFYYNNSMKGLNWKKNNSNSFMNETNVKGKNITLNFKVAPKHNYSFEVFNTHEVYGNTW